MTEKRKPKVVIDQIEQDHENVDYGTRWPKTIGRKYKPNDDGKMRGSDGSILE
jgi:hypothetical protein